MENDWWHKLADETQQEDGIAIAAQISAMLIIGGDENISTANELINNLREESTKSMGGWASEILAKLDAFNDSLGLK